MTRDELLAKIRKCLALSASANEHEAAAALAKARALMDEHGIVESDVQFADISESEAKRKGGAKPTAWHVALIDMVAGVFACEVYLSKGAVNFAGAGPDPEIASYAYARLAGVLARHRRAYIATNLKRCKPATKTARADWYCQGWVRGVHVNVLCIVPERRECPLARQWLAERKTLATITARGPKKTRGDVGSGDYWNGHVAGSEVQLHHGLGSAAMQQPVRLA